MCASPLSTALMSINGATTAPGANPSAAFIAPAVSESCQFRITLFTKTGSGTSLFFAPMGTSHRVTAAAAQQPHNIFPLGPRGCLLPPSLHFMLAIDRMRPYMGTKKPEYGGCILSEKSKGQLSPQERGGLARRDRLTPARRSDIATRAAQARWNRETPNANLASIEDFQMNADAIDAADILVTELSEQAALLSQSGVNALSGGHLGEAKLIISAIEEAKALRLVERNS